MFYPASGRGEPGASGAGGRAVAADAVARSLDTLLTGLVSISFADDLGDLMQEMREGAAWADGLSMECELPSSAAFDRSPSAASQLPQQRTTQQPGEQQEAPLQACMAAKLMHPSAARSGCEAGNDMIPVNLSGAGCEGESEPQTQPPGSNASNARPMQHSGWQPMPFAGTPAMQQASSLYGHAPPLAHPSDSSQPLAGYQPPPAHYMPSEIPSMPQLMQLGGYGPGGYDASGMMASVPRGGFQVCEPTSWHASAARAAACNKPSTLSRVAGIDCNWLQRCALRGFCIVAVVQLVSCLCPRAPLASLSQRCFLSLPTLPGLS